MDSFKVVAPSRADLAGGTLDLWPIYCLVGGGRTINVALDLFATAAFEVSENDKFSIEVTHSTGATASSNGPWDPKTIETLPDFLRFPVFILNSYLLARAELPRKRIRIHLESQVPPKSGLGGSSTLCVAIARGLTRVFGHYVEQGWQWRLLNWVKDVEAGFLRVPTGTQDYLAAMFGGLQCYRSEFGFMESTGYPEQTFAQLSERMLILFSGELHQSGLTNWEVFRRTFEGDMAVQGGFEKLKQLTETLDQALLAASVDWKIVGKYFQEEWQIRKGIFQVHTTRLEEVMQFLITQKVLGAKVCGAAGGGSLMALIEPGRMKEVAKACEQQGIHVLSAKATRQGLTVTATAAQPFSK